MKLLFTITYRKETEDGCYWSSNGTTTVKVYAKNIQEAKEKINKIDSEARGAYKYNKILHWEAEEILEKEVDVK